MRALLLAVALSGCGGEAYQPGDPENATTGQLGALPGQLGGYCEGPADCTGTPRFRSCEEGTCRAWCSFPVNPERGPQEGLPENCDAMGGFCAADGECLPGE